MKDTKLNLAYKTLQEVEAAYNVIIEKGCEEMTLKIMKSSLMEARLAVKLLENNVKK